MHLNKDFVYGRPIFNSHQLLFFCLEYSSRFSFPKECGHTHCRRDFLFLVEKKFHYTSGTRNERTMIVLHKRQIMQIGEWRWHGRSLWHAGRVAVFFHGNFGKAVAVTSYLPFPATRTHSSISNTTASCVAYFGCQEQEILWHNACTFPPKRRKRQTKNMIKAAIFAYILYNNS